MFRPGYVRTLTSVGVARTPSLRSAAGLSLIRSFSVTFVAQADRKPRRWDDRRRKRNDDNKPDHNFQDSLHEKLKKMYEESMRVQRGQARRDDEDKSHDKSHQQEHEPAKDKGGKKPEPQIYEFNINLTSVLIGTAALFLLTSLLMSADFTPEISYQEFKTQYLDKGLVSHLEIVNNQAAWVFLRENQAQPACVFTIGSVDMFEKHLKEAQDSLGIAPQDRIPVSYREEGSLLGGLFSLLPTLMFLGFLVWMGRRASQRGSGAGGGVFGIGKTKAQLYNPNTAVKVRFADVAGCDEAKGEIMEFVSFLKNPKKYERLGAKIPRGAILSGAPGTGKTLLAKATAGEAGVPFFSVSGSEFVEMFSGVGASRVRDLFKKAKEQAPSMIWIDEIDAIGKARTGANIRGGNDEREATLNQLLVEMDGFDSKEHVVVLAGTNRPDVLDKALLRPGRFDRHINIDLPTLDGRKDIYKVHLDKIKYDHDIEELPGKLAAMTPGFSGADIANCCNEAALAAARDNAKQIEMKHFERAIDRVIAGLERRSRVLPVDKRRIVAYHEAGHAVAGWFLRYADPLVKVTIVPHGAAALGYAQLLPSDNNITTENRMLDLIVVALGGRTSEEIFFPTITVGASDDFKRITGIAKAMVMDYGMSPKLGAVHLDRQPGATAKSFSEETDAVVDEEVKKIIDTAHTKCKDLLLSHKEQVEAVAEELLSKEVLTRQDLIRLLGPRPHQENEHEAFKKYLDVN